MTDSIMKQFLEDQQQRGTALAADSDVLELVAIQDEQHAPPQRYIAKYNCKSVLCEDGQIHVAESEFHVGISFGENHLRQVDPLRLVTWLGPGNIVHPNVRPPMLCVGRLHSGITLVDILYQVFEIITYVNWSSHDLLHEPAAQWARNNQQLFPVDRTALRRRKPRPIRKAADKRNGGSVS